ncbi:MAG TPA: flagellar filament capping protein FliD [Pyrinomonadaceae bacterium]|nr:flagellar filament capping protein FliD [Pyrinomonadaceae bacterium]
MAGEISFSGLGGSLDFSAVRDAIVAQRMRPVVQLQQRSNNLENRSAALKQLNTLLLGLRDSATGLTDRTLGTGRSAVSSDDSILTASAMAAAAFGSLTVSVGRLATSLSQASKTFNSLQAPVLADGATEATFELRKAGASTGTAITIGSGNNSLTGLRDAINGANAGVTASIVDLTGAGTQFQLVLTSTETGTAGRVELAETTSTGTLAGLEIRSLNPLNATNDFSALNAEVTINGLTITRSSNSISDAISGVELNLQHTGLANVTVGQSTDITDKLTKFVETYNTLQDYVAGQYKTDSEGRPTGVLAGDPTIRLVQQQLRDALTAFSTTNGGSLTSLSDLGITRTSDNKLKLDTDVLKDRLQGNLGDVRALLYGSGNNAGIFSAVDKTLNTLTDNIDGTVHMAIEGYQSSIKRLADSIANQTERVNQLRDSLTLQFAKLDAAIGQLNSQGTALSTMMSALKASKEN